MATAKARGIRKPEEAAVLSTSPVMLLVTRDFRVLGRSGDLPRILPALHVAQLSKLPHCRTGSAIRLLINGVERGQMKPDAVLDVPASPGRPPLRVSMLPVPGGAGDGRIFAILIEPVRVAAVQLKERIRFLEEQGRSTEDCLRTTIEEYEATIEELRCSYEELRSANEELQATTLAAGDLQTTTAATRDRLEALNRILQTQNHRLQRQHDEFHGLLNSIGIPVVLLGNDLSVRFFNRPAERLFHLTAADEGTPFERLDAEFAAKTLNDVCRRVLQELHPEERLVGNRSFRIRPFLTIDGRIEGVTLLVMPGPAG